MRARSFKLRPTRTELIFWTMHIQRETAFGGFHKRSAYCNDGPACGNRQMQKAEGPRSGTVAFAADCAFIALLRA